MELSNSVLALDGGAKAETRAGSPSNKLATTAPSMA
jgi:hypothetical protein